MNIEHIVSSAAEEVWSAGDLYIGPRTESLEWFFRLCMSKLAEQAIEPTGYLYSDDPEVCAYPGSGYFHGEVPPNDAINIIPLFTEASLAAAQQRTAEACAKVCEAVRAEDGDGQHLAWYAGFYMCIDAIRNGEWREYL